MEKWSDLLSNQTLGEAMFLAKKAQAARSSGLTVYPPQSQIFQALTLTPPEKVKAGFQCQSRCSHPAVPPEYFPGNAC